MRIVCLRNSLDRPVRATKRHMPKRWFEGQPKHTHVAEDDARGQGMLFIAMLKESRSRSA